MSRRRNKQNRISALIRKQPSKCIYEKGVKRLESEQRLVDADAVRILNKMIDEQYEKNPYDLYATGQASIMIALGLREKESPEAGTSGDSSNF